MFLQMFTEMQKTNKQKNKKIELLKLHPTLYKSEKRGNLNPQSFI